MNLDPSIICLSRPLYDTKSTDSDKIKSLESIVELIKYAPSIDLESIMFPFSIILNYEKVQPGIKLSSRVYEAACLGLSDIAQMKSERVWDMTKNGSLGERVFSSCNPLFINAVDQPAMATSTEDLQIAILKCYKSILTSLDSEQLHPAIVFLDTPLSDLPDGFKLFPEVESAKRDRLVKNSAYPMLLINTVYLLTKTIKSDNHTLTYLSLQVLYLLVVLTDGVMMIPSIPGIFSAFGIKLNTQPLIGWREKEFILLIFAQLVHLSYKDEEKTPRNTFAEWIEALHPQASKVTSEVVKEENESTESFYSRLVLHDKDTKYGPVFSIIGNSFYFDDNRNITFIGVTCACSLLSAAVHWGTEPFYALFDYIITLLVNPEFSLYTQSCIDHLAIRYMDELYSHLLDLLLHLPAVMRLSPEKVRCGKLRHVYGYFVFLKEELNVIFQSDEELKVLYGALMEVLSISELYSNLIYNDEKQEGSTDRFYKILFRYLGEDSFQVVKGWVHVIQQYLQEDKMATLVYWVMSDNMNNCRESAYLYSMLQPSTSIHSEYRMAMLDYLKYSNAITNGGFILLSLASDLPSASLPQYLFLLFYYRANEEEEEKGVIYSCFQRLLSEYHLESISSLVTQYFDYLSNMIILHLRHYSTQIPHYIRITYYLWNTIRFAYTKGALSFLVLESYLRDTIEVLVSLLNQYYSDCIVCFQPLVMILVMEVNLYEKEDKKSLKEMIREKLKRYPDLTPIYPEETEMEHIEREEEDESAPSRITLLQSIVDTVKYYSSSASLSVTASIYSLLQTLSSLESSRLITTFLNPFFDFILSHLQSPNASIFLPSVRLLLFILDHDTITYASKFASLCWPALSCALEDAIVCLAEQKYTAIMNKRTAEELIQVVLKEINGIYHSSAVFVDVAGDMACRVIEIKRFCDEYQGYENIGVNCDSLMNCLKRWNLDMIEECIIDNTSASYQIKDGKE